MESISSGASHATLCQGFECHMYSQKSGISISGYPNNLKIATNYKAHVKIETEKYWDHYMTVSLYFLAESRKFFAEISQLGP